MKPNKRLVKSIQQFGNKMKPCDSLYINDYLNPHMQKQYESIVKQAFAEARKESLKELEAMFDEGG